MPEQTAEELLDGRAGLALANAAWNEGAHAMLRAVNAHETGPWSAPVSPYSAPLLRRIAEDRARALVGHGAPEPTGGPDPRIDWNKPVRGVASEPTGENEHG